MPLLLRMRRSTSNLTLRTPVSRNSKQSASSCGPRSTPYASNTSQTRTAATTTAELKAKTELLTVIADAVRESLSEPERVAFGARIVHRLGRACGEFVSRFTDFGSLFNASTKRDDDLQEIISMAQPNSRGTAVVVARGTLQARGVPVIGPSYTGGSSRFKDEFNGEYATEL